MDYTKCEFEFSEDNEIYGDILASLLGEIGFDSFEYNAGVLSAYIVKSSYNEENTLDVISEFPINGISISFDKIDMSSQDWNSSWESSFTPIQLDDLVYIHPSSFPRKEGVRHDIIINPRMAFGSGSHSTTKLVLRMLLSSGLTEKSVLDLGCGTGILGIAAKLAGCGDLTFMDIDSDSVSNTIENMEMNGISSCETIEGSIDDLPSARRFDIILANIHLNVHINLMDTYRSRLNDSGELYLSGFFESDEAQIIKRASEAGFILSDKKSEEGWSALKFCPQLIY